MEDRRTLRKGESSTLYDERSLRRDSEWPRLAQRGISKEAVRSEWPCLAQRGISKKVVRSEWPRLAQRGISKEAVRSEWPRLAQGGISKKAAQSKWPRLAQRGISKKAVWSECPRLAQRGITKAIRSKGESHVVVATEASNSSGEISPALGQGQLNGEGGFPGVASRSSGGPEVAPDEHAGLDVVVVETRSTLTSINDLRNIWELFFTSFEREISSALKTHNPDAPKQGLASWFYLQTQGRGKNMKRLIEPLSDAPKKWKRYFFFVVPREGRIPSWWFDSEGEALFPPKCIELNSENPRPNLGDCSDESLRTISALANLGPPKKLQSLLMTGENGSGKQNIARILASAKREEAKRGRASSMPSESSTGSRRMSDRSSKRKEAAVYKDPKSQGPLHPRKLVITEGGEKKRDREKSPEISSPAAKKSKTSHSSKKTALVDLSQTLPSPPSVVPPSAEKEISLLSYDAVVDYDTASLIRNRMSCSDDRSTFEKLVREHGPWALRDFLRKEMVRMCSTYAAFVKMEQKMVDWYKDRLREVSDTHEDCEKAINALTSERDKLKLEKETAVVSMELYRSKMSGFELDARNLKEQNKYMSERNDNVFEQNVKLTEELAAAVSARDKLVTDSKEHLDLLSKSQEEIDDLIRALEAAQDDHKFTVLGAKDSIDWAWNNCLDQVNLLNPDFPITFEGMNVYLTVVDGKLVSTTSPEEETNEKDAEEKEVIDVEKIDPSSPPEIPMSLANLFEEAPKDPSIAGTIPSDKRSPSKAPPAGSSVVVESSPLPNDPTNFLVLTSTIRLRTKAPGLSGMIISMATMPLFDLTRIS
ncbi:uncharacterized protein G2W53_014074 [Senna tora]|uniref:Uncharacterized protein n=1 Tax=Senna tora TaxID=362788 RepID=A0A834WSF5_9FABA|nr:uncharacterized protein G2W53_014074 [Senna tora]